MKIATISNYFECNKRSAVHAGVLNLRWCITFGINNYHDVYVAFYSVYFSYKIG